MILSLKGRNKTKKTKVKKKTSPKRVNKKSEKQLSEKEILRTQRQKVQKLIEDWKDIMYQTGTHNKYNQTFTFDDIKYEQFGFSAKLYSPKGLTFKTLDTIRDKIEDGLHCIFIYNKERLDRYMEIRIVTKLSTNKKYSPPVTKPWEMYIGDKFDGSPIIVDLNKWCQVLISGTTGGGKSKLLDCAIATQIYNHSVEDLELYLIQLDKCDLLLYEDAKICRGFADNLDKAIILLEHVLEENQRRTKLVASVKKMGLGSNITDYNEINKDKKVPTIWVTLDEMASIAEKSSDSPIIKAKKQLVDDLLSAVAQYGRSNNIFLTSCLQRPTSNLLNPFVKSMSNLKISFRQSNAKSSEVSMDDSSIALDLAQRVAVYKLLSYDFLQTPFISDPIIMKYIKEKLKPNHMTIFDTMKANKRLQELKGSGGKPNDKEDKSQSQQSSGKENATYEQQLKQKEEELKKIHEELIKNQEKIEKMALKLKFFNENNHKDKYDMVEKSINRTLDDVLQENINKNPNWVPYVPPETGKEIIK